MYSEILWIKTKLDQKDFMALTKALQGRFTKIAKGFGKGLLSAVKGGGVIGVALGLIDKLLNPLQAVQEAIDKSLKMSSDIVTNAAQFGTSAGRLFKLQQVAESKGLDEGSLYMLIGKFQTAVAEANANPNAPSTVRNFAQNPDTAAGFFEFIQALQKMTKEQQILAQQSVFGEKQTLKMAEFLQTDFADQFLKIGAKSAETYTPGLQRLDGYDDMANALKARQTMSDTLVKSKVIREDMIKAKAAGDQLALDRENQQIQGYNDLRAISDTVTKLMTAVEAGIGLIGKLISVITPFVNQAADFMVKFAKSPMMRGLFKWGKGD